ncbi:RNA polymerase [Pseudomonas phage vB_PpuP-Kurepalu-1]
MNQIELEQMMLDGGRARVLGHINRNEEAGAAHNNPYAHAIYRRFVQPLADLITTFTSEIKRGVQSRGKALLRDFDPQVLAYMTIRGVLDSMVEEATVTSVASSVGKSIYGEKLLTQFEDINPELYYTLVHDFERRLTKSERHKLTVFKQQAQKNDIALPVWSAAEVVSVGSILVYLARDVGIVDFETRFEKKRQTLFCHPNPDVAGLMDQITSFVAGASPMHLPCVEPPRDWVAYNDGGYHTQEMRCQSPYVMRGASMGSIAEGDVPPNVLRALNRLQRDRWAVNTRVLDAVDQVSRHFDVGEVLSQAEFPKPSRPEWLAEDMAVGDMTPIQLAEFAGWKAMVREWYTASKVRSVKWGRFYEAIRVARQFRDWPVYFVWQCDYRGRFYATTRGLSPQGSDLQKALLSAYSGAPINTVEAQQWFKLAATGRFGNDKGTLKERVQWVDDNHDMLLAIADDPISNRQWTEADSPFQFLAWCFEYADWRLNPSTFLTRLPLGQDGSCNGLQHFSAMLRDEVGGKATNLVAGERKQDIYGLVAVRTAELVAASPDDESAIAQRWKKHTLSRGLVKRSVMTLPYGSTRFSCADFILKEYLRAGQAPEFTKEEYQRAAGWLSFRVWAAIADVVVMAPQAMEWLQRASDELIAAGCDEVVWKAPSGFVVRQRYFNQQSIQIHTRIMGDISIKLRVADYDEQANKRGHRNGIAPNFVHSCDAAHMHALINAAEDAGLGHLAFIHDDYGALAPDVAKLHELIRSTFIQMYEEHDPLAEFAEYHGLPETPPAKGQLDIKAVQQSTFFFCG